MNPLHVVVISDSFHTLPEAVATLTDSGHRVTYVTDLTAWSQLTEVERDALREADAVVMGRVMGIDDEALALAPKLKVIALHTSGSDNVDRGRSDAARRAGDQRKRRERGAVRGVRDGPDAERGAADSHRRPGAARRDGGAARRRPAWMWWGLRWG